MPTIKNVGYYTHTQVQSGETCKLCHDVEEGDVLIYEYDLEGEGICGKCLLEHYNFLINQNTNTDVYNG